MATTGPQNKREAPVSFRPGRLRGALSVRAVRSLGEGHIAKRDLGRYYLLLGRVPLDERLTRREASWLARAAFQQDLDDSFSADPFLPEHMDPSEELTRIVRNGMRSHIHDDVGDAVELKIRDMLPLERAALMDAIDRLPAETEEQVGDPANWALIGIRLADDSADWDPERNS